MLPSDLSWPALQLGMAQGSLLHFYAVSHHPQECDHMPLSFFLLYECPNNSRWACFVLPVALACPVASRGMSPSACSSTESIRRMLFYQEESTHTCT